MTNDNHQTTFGNEPTQQEIRETRERVNKRYGVELSDEAALRYTRLHHQLRWFLIRDLLREDRNEPSTDDANKVQMILKEQFGADVSIENAGHLASLATQYTSQHDKDQIAAEMSAIIKQAKNN